MGASEAPPEMRVRRLGREGPEVSVLGLGCNNFGWRIDAATSGAVIDAAIEVGITLFDTADCYGATESEQFLGEALGRRRDQLVLVTKFGLPVPGAPQAPPGSVEYVRWAIDGSLRRLRTNAVDVYLYHRPDGITPIGETVEALGEVVRQGKARFVGLSNGNAEQLAEAAAVARRTGVPLVAAENRYSLLHRTIEADVLPECVRSGIGLLPFYPLESGLLTGKYQRGQAPPPDSRFAAAPAIWPEERWLTDGAFDRVEALQRFARARGLALLDVAIGGLAALGPVASIIAGATRPDQIRANARASAWQPSAADLAELDELTSSARRS